MRLGARVVMDRSGRVGGRPQEARHQCTIHYLKCHRCRDYPCGKKYEIDARSASLLIGLLTKHDPHLHVKPASTCMNAVMTFIATCWEAWGFCKASQCTCSAAYDSFVESSVEDVLYGALCQCFQQHLQRNFMSYMRRAGALVNLIPESSTRFKMSHNVDISACMHILL